MKSLFRARTGVRWIALAALCAALIGPETAAAQPQDAIRQRCINAMNKGLAGVAKAQAKVNVACQLAAAQGKLPLGQSAQECLSADNRGLVAKERAKLASTQTAFCTKIPNFGFTDAATVASVGAEQGALLFNEFFGSDLDAAIDAVADDAVGQECQATLAKAYAKIVSGQFKSFLKCKADGLADGSITSAAGIENCLTIVKADADGATGRLVVKLADSIGKACGGVNLSAAFPGRCAGSSDFARCIEEAISCRNCLAVNGADAAERYCDQLDNGAADASCVDPARCGNGTLEAGEACDDGNNVDDDCCSATCESEPVDQPCADDGNVCTDDKCSGTGFCLHPNNVLPCDDGIFCNGADTCEGGTCSVHPGDPCTAGNLCNNTCNEDVDTCFSPNDTLCEDDENECTNNRCDGAGVCQPLPEPETRECTDDGQECTTDFCDGAGQCGHPNKDEGTACTADSSDCTEDECDGNGACAHPPLNAGVACGSDGNVCTTDLCDGSGTCAHTANTSPCDDGQFCTETDVCSNSVCVGTGNPCSTGGVCSNSCNESADNCLNLSGTACTSDGNGCTNDVCDGSGVCTHPNNTVACSDGLFCNGADTCSGGSCSVHAGNPCSGGGQCSDLCSESGDHCNDPNGTGCNDGNACTTGDTCNGSGTCVGGAAPNCADSDPCTIDSCNTGTGCVHTDDPTCKWASPTGTGATCSKASPCSLVTALTDVGTGKEVRAAAGTYNTDNEITALKSSTTLRGGYNTSTWTQNQGCSATIINRTSNNPDGSFPNRRLVALQLSGRSGYVVDCLRITTAGATETGMSIYGVHLTSNSGYSFNNVTIAVGEAGDGAGGSSGGAGASGSGGGTGGGGDPDSQINAPGG
ncbi:MAG TPA: hypothetical protein VEL28_07125, partial [Candidatus Binatia bacterium]|nr:hypothetical protein [Candidatus Binatia bacterium]